MIKNFIHTILGAIVAFVGVNLFRRIHIVEYDAGHLVPAHIVPGPWYAYYMGDFMVAFDTPHISSAIVEMPDGSHLWATETPEWDRDWFEEHMGWEFPENWVTYTDLSKHNLTETELGE